MRSAVSRLPISVFLIFLGFLGQPVRISFASEGPEDATTGTRKTRETPTVVAVRKARPAVVSLRCLTYSKGLEMLFTAPSLSAGSGIIVDPRGYILTNAHVVAGVDAITTRVPGDVEQYKTTLLSSMPDQDLALVKVEARNPLPTVPFGSSKDLQLGETLLAIGYPVGMGSTVTRGIFSAWVDELSIGPTRKFSQVIQTDAAINPGNSGGALVNLDGELVGVTTAMHAGARGIAFGLPIDSVRENLAELIRLGHPKRGSPGILAKTHEYSNQRALYVESTGLNKGSEGLTHGDRILRANGQTVHDEADFEFALASAKPGDSLVLDIGRGSADVTVTVVLEESR